MDGQGIDVLIVEDNPDHAELTIKELTGRAGIIRDLRLVKDGEEALEYLFRQGGYADPASSPRPGLILLDLKLPKIDGLDVLKKIRMTEEFDDIPVIVLTTSAHESDIIRSFKSGTNLFITKPVKIDNFISALENLISF